MTLDFNYDRTREEAVEKRKTFEPSSFFEASCIDCYAFMNADFNPTFDVGLNRPGSDPRDWSLRIDEISVSADPLLFVIS